MSTTTDPLATDGRFSTVLRERTAGDHGDAESSQLMRDLVAGTLPHARVGHLLGQHLVLYRALEDVAARLADHPVVAPFLFPGLARTAVLEADVESVLGAGAAATVAPAPATQAYVERIGAVADWPAGFVAHHYTRYMGDLSGGQIIGRIVARAYPDLPIGFYTFGGIESPKALKEAYRSRLDEAPWDDDERERVVDEVRRAYALNTAMFAQLDEG